MGRCAAIAAAAGAAAAAAGRGAPPPPLPQHWSPRVPCRGDADCVLNGECRAGKCACDAGWEGVSCDQLALRPAPAVGAYGARPNISSWGSSVVKVGAEYHMYVSEFWNGCGLTSWQHNSHIVHAVAPTAAGPFTYRDTVQAPFSHNPKVLPAAGGGHYLLFHVGDGGPYPAQSRCGGATDPAMCPANCTERCRCGGANPAEVWPAGLVTKGPLNASAPGGPWAPATGGPWPIGGQCANPAPARAPNGTVAVACHSNGLAIWSAPSDAGPFTKVAQILGNQPIEVNGSDGRLMLSVWEDPFLWVDARGHWHLVCHTIPRGHPYNNIVSGHAFSPDGASWTFAAAPPWGATVAHEGGATVTYATRERPALLFEGGRPTALYTSVVPYGGAKGKGETGKTDWSFTLMQPIA